MHICFSFHLLVVLSLQSLVFSSLPDLFFLIQDLLWFFYSRFLFFVLLVYCSKCSFAILGFHPELSVVGIIIDNIVNIVNIVNIDNIVNIVNIVNIIMGQHNNYASTTVSVESPFDNFVLVLSSS